MPVRFLIRDPSVEKMAAVIDASLYRRKRDAA
jgi:hypothetical protein